MTKSGAADEKLVQDWLLMNDWTVHRAAAAGLHKAGKFFFTKSHDLFGCIDLLAFKIGNLPCETHAIQVTTATNRSARRKKVDALATKWPVSWRVSVVVHEHERRGKTTVHFLCFEDLWEAVWQKQESVEIDMKAIETWRKRTSGVAAILGGGE